jgi:hypothetical protein
MSPQRPPPILLTLVTACTVALASGRSLAETNGAAESPVESSAAPVPVVPAPPVRMLEPGAPPLANRRYQTGIEMYVRGDFAGAAREFRVAAALAPGSAKLAYNLARSLERAGDVPGAITEYRRYLSLAPAAADRAEVEGVVAVLEREREPARASETPGVVAPAAATETGLSGREVAAWACTGGAVVAAVVGAVFTASAVGARNDAATLGPDDTARHAALKDDYETGQLGAGLGFGLAGAGALAAGLLFFWPGAGGGPSAAVGATPGGAGWTWSF